MDFRIAASTDIGRVRAQNEDSYLAALPLVAVADGMGGHKAGEVASGLALSVLDEWKSRPAPDGGLPLEDAVLEANRTVWSKAQEDQSLHGMGTTLTAAWLDGETASVAHVGDSRAYLLRDGNLLQLTQDQTLVREWVEEGKIEAEEASRHPYRSVLLQALGVDPEVNVDMLRVDLHAGDRLLLATDGLHGQVDDDRIREILMNHPDPDEACRTLVQAANAAGGEDNVTVLILDALGDGAPAPGAPPPVTVEKPIVKATKAPARRRWPVVAVPAIIGVVAIGLILLLAGRSDGWLVGVSDDRVAILRGSPGKDGKPPDARVEVTTDLEVSRLPQPIQSNLRSGIPVESREEAEKTIDNYRKLQTLGPEETPSPTPSVTPPSSPPPEAVPGAPE